VSIEKERDKPGCFLTIFGKGNFLPNCQKRPGVADLFTAPLGYTRVERQSQKRFALRNGRFQPKQHRKEPSGGFPVFKSRPMLLRG